MYLNIILTILVVVLITMTYMVNRWWKKYGLKMFDSMEQLKKISPKNMNTDMKSMMFDLQKIIGGWH